MRLMIIEKSRILRWKLQDGKCQVPIFEMGFAHSEEESTQSMVWSLKILGSRLECNFRGEICPPKHNHKNAFLTVQHKHFYNSSISKHAKHKCCKIQHLELAKHEITGKSSSSKHAKRLSNPCVVPWKMAPRTQKRAPFWTEENEKAQGLPSLYWRKGEKYSNVTRNFHLEFIFLPFASALHLLHV